MAADGGEWIMQGLEWDNPYRIRTWRELVSWINEVGFLPLFKNEAAGFSVEEHVFGPDWWTGDRERDPWIWREIIAGSGEVAYGKFFNKKSGFVSLEWFPRFANFRRDGYDFDAKWDDELANIRCKKIMDVFETKEDCTGLELKRAAGFGKDGEKNFDGIVTELQMESYLVIREFKRKRNKKGAEYGMPVSVYAKPETVWGYGMVSAAYSEEPGASWERIFAHVRQKFPEADERMIKKVLR